MNLARVIGTVWATRKVAHTDGATLQLVQPLTGELEPAGEPFAACDTVGAGPGELVLYVTAYEAAIPYMTRPGGPGLGALVPMDASIVGIVEQLHRGEGHRPEAARPAAAKAAKPGKAGKAAKGGKAAKAGKAAKGRGGPAR